MPVYTVHAPLANGTVANNPTDRFMFVRDRFSFWAFIAGPLWLIYHRLWLALTGYIALMIASGGTLSLLHVSAETRSAVMILIALLMGFEASSLRRWTFSRRNWRQLDVVVADDEETAERRFFDRWTVRKRDVRQDQTDVDRGAPPPIRDTSSHRFSRPPTAGNTEIVGLFPQPGMPR